MPSSPISSAGQPLARPDDYRSIDSKVHRALSLFESLRASLDAPGSPTSAFIAMSARGGGDGLADASEASPTTSTDITGTSRPLASFVPTKGEAAAVISAGTYTEEELAGLTKAELRKKLVTAGNIMKRLHAKNQGLVQQVKYLDTIMKESEAKPSNESRASPHQATEDRTSELLENLRRAHATELKAHAARHADAMAKQEAYLYTKEEQIEELLGGNADLQSQLRQLQESLRQMEVGSTQQRADMEDKLKRKVKKLKQQRDDLESKQATLQMECDRACNAARKAEEELKSCQPSTHQSSAPSHEGLPNVVGGSSGHTTVVQDAVTTLQFRLQQANNQVQKLMDVQLDAILRDDRNNGPQHTELINRDVKQLFGIMKHSMIGDAVMHEAERSRMNEVLYALERREASSFNNRSL